MINNTSSEAQNTVDRKYKSGNRERIATGRDIIQMDDLAVINALYTHFAHTPKAALES
jgi:hypothetical protein